MKKNVWLVFVCSSSLAFASIKFVGGLQVCIFLQIAPLRTFTLKKSSFFRKRTKQLLCSTITIAISTSDINNKSNIIIINFSTNSSSRSINTKSVNNGGSSVVGSPCMFEMKVLLRRMMNRGEVLGLSCEAEAGKLLHLCAQSTPLKAETTSTPITTPFNATSNAKRR